MTSRPCLLAPAAIIALGSVAIGCGASTAPRSAPSALLDKSMPDFRRRDVSGEEIDTEKMRGRAIVVKFFADYCEPCKRTLPAVESLREKRGDVRFIGISEDEDPALARAVAARYGLTFPVVHDAGQVLAGRFRVGELPITFVVGPEGNVRWVGGPRQSDGDLAAALDAIAR
jgi:peroxiredoxin